MRFSCKISPVTMSDSSMRTTSCLTARFAQSDRVSNQERVRTRKPTASTEREILVWMRGITVRFQAFPERSSQRCTWVVHVEKRRSNPSPSARLSIADCILLSALLRPRTTWTFSGSSLHTSCQTLGSPAAFCRAVLPFRVHLCEFSSCEISAKVVKRVFLFQNFVAFFLNQKTHSKLPHVSVRTPQGSYSKWSIIFHHYTIK